MAQRLNGEFSSRANRGVTLIEMLVASLLLTMVFAAAMSVYSTSLKILKSSRDASSGAVIAPISVEDVAKKIAQANDVDVTGAGANFDRIHLRVDQNNPPTPGNPPGGSSFTSAGDDSYCHYQFVTDAAGKRALRGKCDNGPATILDVTNAILVRDLNAAVAASCDPATPTGGSCFALRNPSAAGPTLSVVYIHIKSAETPPRYIDTQVAVGGKTKAH